MTLAFDSGLCRPDPLEAPALVLKLRARTFPSGTGCDRYHRGRRRRQNRR
jgi:hypothetical protein